MNQNVTTIQLRKSVVRSLKEIKEYKKETYEEVILKLIKTFKNIQTKNQYDEFLHKIQQDKMKELWDNKEDEAWENV